MTFSEIVSAWLELHAGPDETNDALNDLAREFEVARSTVKRWGSDIAKPHPGIKVQILKHIAEVIGRYQRRINKSCVCDWCDGCKEINNAIEGWTNE